MYQVLARKYRPRNFSQLVGQTHVSRALSSALERGRLHHAYLFTGTRGVGKTTIARILAKCLNCETGVTATPCEQCTVCKAVNEGRFIDLIEIDAASRTRVEDTRELLDNVPYAPTQGRYKVYLIDEVHMLSTHSFNALLKTLEEPPEHVKFLFATTDPQKLPITVISRCLQFTLRPLGKDEMFKHLDQILNQENIQHQPEALWQLAESAQGSLRDALSLTDQAIAYGQGQVLAQDVKEMLGLIDKSLIFDLLTAIYHNQRQQVAELIQSMRQQAIDVQHVLEQLISTLHEVALLQVLGTPLEQITEDIQRKQQLAAQLHAQDLQLYYQIALQGRSDLALALTPEQGFEMCIMRLLAFRPIAQGEVIPVSAQTQDTVPQPVVQQDQPSAIVPFISLPASTEDLTVSNPDHEIPPEPEITELQQESIAIPPPPVIEEIQESHLQPVAQDIVEPDLNIQEEVEPEPELFSNQQLSVDEVSVHVDKAATEENHQEKSDQRANTIDTVEVDDPRTLLQPQPQNLTGQWTVEKWDYWLRQANLSPAVKELAQHGSMQGEIGGVCELRLDPTYQRIFDGFVETLKVELQQLDVNSQLKVSYQSVEDTTPLELQKQRRDLAYHTAQQKVYQHPVILQLTEQFSATVEHLKLKI